MPSLKKLEFSTNKLTNLKTLPDLPNLESIDISTNMISDGNCISDLIKFKKLSKFSAAANPFFDEMADKFKQEVLFRLHPIVKIKYLGEDEVNEDDLIQWKAERRERTKA